MQIFQQLPHNLVVSMIQEAKLGLSKSLALLPTNYHSLAVQAHFPNITRRHSLSVPEALLAGAVAPNVLGPTFKVLGTYTQLQRLRLCTPVHSRVPADVLTDFEGAISQLHSLRDLHMEGGLVTNAVVEAIARALSHARPHITSVALHRVGEAQDSSAAQPLVLQSIAIFDSLKLCNKLQSVSMRYISCRRGTDEGVGSLSPAALLSVPTLTSLTLAHNAITADTLHQMAQHVRTAESSNIPVPKLQELNIRMNRIRDNGVQPLGELLHSMNSLQRLDLSWNEITAVGCTDLLPTFSVLTALEHVEVGGNLIGDGLAAFAETMCYMQRLQHLNMKACRSSPGDGWWLGALVGRLSRLTNLDLHANSLGGGPDSLEGVRSLSASLQQLNSLQELRFSIIDRLYTEALGILLPSISLQRDLQTLQIKSATTFTWSLFWPEQTASLESVAHHISKLTKLQSLSLGSGVQMPTADARALTVALPSSLQTLHLRCMPGAESQQELDTSLSKLTALEDLSLSECGFNESSAAALGAAIVCMPALTRLCLKGNNLRDSGAIELAAAMQRSHSLQQVDLSGTGLSEVGAIAIVGAADAQGTVTTCWLRDNKIKRKALPKRSRKFTLVLGCTSQEIALVSSTTLA